MKEWKKSGDYSSVEDIIIQKSGQTLRQLQSPAPLNPGYIDHISECVLMIKTCIPRKMPIWIIGDYDADGITATAILVKQLQYLGASPETIIPKRFTDGYGISEKMVAGIRNSLIFTVDNGITAVDAVKAAKASGNMVAILDHHVPGPELPPADAIVNPCLPGDCSLYRDYCGAGLAYKLSEYLCMGRERSMITALFKDLTVLATIGTLADVMPLTGDNRRIVKAGLSILNSRKSFSQLSPGIRALCAMAQPPYTEESISRLVVPVLNSVGRLYNAGGTSALKALLCGEQKDALIYAGKMKVINQKRKELVKHWHDIAHQEAVRQADAPVLNICCPDMPEGILGIVAGMLAEELQRPAFIFGKSIARNNQLKCSVRSYGRQDLSPLLNHIRPYSLDEGGHSSAAGLTVASSNYTEMSKAIQEYTASAQTPSPEKALYYDMEVRESQLPVIMKILKSMAPFGEGVQKPVFVLPEFHCSDYSGGGYHLLGQGREHVRLSGKECDAIGFDLAETYAKLGYPTTVDLLGTVEENHFHGHTSVQFHILDMRASA